MGGGKNFLGWGGWVVERKILWRSKKNLFGARSNTKIFFYPFMCGVWVDFGDGRKWLDERSWIVG